MELRPICFSRSLRPTRVEDFAGRSVDIHVDQKDRSAARIGQSTTPDIFLSRTQLLALEFLERCVLEMEPLAALTGGAGSGKTVVLNALVARQENTARRVIRVNNFVAGPLSLHRVLASAFGVMDAGDLSAEALEPVLRRALVDAGRSEPPVLAVDDAQSLLPETLRYLCLLAGLKEAGRPLLRIMLAGRPGFAIRQSMPRQFILEALAPEDARQLALHRIGAAGVALSDDSIEDIVRNGQGNLRKLDVLLNAAIETARTVGRRRTITRRGQAGSGLQKARPARGSAGGRWLVVPAVLVAGAAALAISYHDGMFGGHRAAPVETAVAPPAPAPEVVAAHPAPLAAVAPAIIGPPVAPSPLTSAPPSVAGPAPVATARLAVPPVQLQRGPPQAAQSPAAQSPAAQSQAVQSPAPQVRGAQLPGVPLQPPSPEPVSPSPAPSSVPPPNSGTPATRFRVYNISACHQGVCPRWSVTDLDQRQHFVAAFNPATLHLDSDTLQRLREGSVDLIVIGSIVRNGSEGRILNAGALQEVAPHRGRSHSPSPPPSPPGSNPIELAPPQLQSPPPGFLPVPPPGQ